MKPRIFISAASGEFRAARDIVAHTVHLLGYEPVQQEVFATESGDLRDMLKSEIDNCKGLIQMVGYSYGQEPPIVDQEIGRASYTQFEFRYAQQQKKLTWLLFADDRYERESPTHELDLPRDRSHPDPAAYQSERWALQQAYRTQLLAGGHIHWHFATDVELENLVLKLRNYSKELWKDFGNWQRIVESQLSVLQIKLDSGVGLSRATIARAAFGIIAFGVLLFAIVSYVGSRHEQHLKSELAILFEQAKIDAASRWPTSSVPSEHLNHLSWSKGTSIEEGQITHLIDEGLKSKDITTVAMAQYLAGDNNNALNSAREGIDTERAQAKRSVSRLAELYTVSALSHMEKGMLEKALEQFKQAGSSYGILGNRQAERETMMLASAAMFCHGDTVAWQGGDMLAKAFSLLDSLPSEFDLYDCAFLFASPGISPGQTPAFGWIKGAQTSEKSEITLIKQVVIAADFSTRSEDRKLEGHGTVTTLPVGFMTLPVKKLLATPVLFREAIQIVAESKFMGKLHPYLFILYLNCADVAWGMGDQSLAAEMGGKITTLYDYHRDRKDTESLVRRIFQTSEARATLERLEQKGFINRDFSQKL